MGVLRESSTGEAPCRSAKRLNSLSPRLAAGVRLFATIDHSGEAERVGLVLRETKLLVFGNPQAGTPLMQANPLIALDLPLKILVWEDDEHWTWMAISMLVGWPSDTGSMPNLPRCCQRSMRSQDERLAVTPEAVDGDRLSG